MDDARAKLHIQIMHGCVTQYSPGMSSFFPENGNSKKTGEKREKRRGNEKRETEKREILFIARDDLARCFSM